MRVHDPTTLRAVADGRIAAPMVHVVARGGPSAAGRVNFPGAHRAYALGLARGGAGDATVPAGPTFAGGEGRE